MVKYLDEDIIVTVAGLNIPKAGTYRYDVSAYDEILFIGNVFLEANQTYANIDITDIAKNIKWDEKQIATAGATQTAKFSVEKAGILNYIRVRVYDNSPNGRSSGAYVAFMYRYPNRKRELELNLSGFESGSTYTPMILRQGKVVPRLPFVETDNYGLGLVYPISNNFGGEDADLSLIAKNEGTRAGAVNLWSTTSDKSSTTYAKYTPINDIIKNINAEDSIISLRGFKLDEAIGGWTVIPLEYRETECVQPMNNADYTPDFIEIRVSVIFEEGGTIYENHIIPLDKRITPIGSPKTIDVNYPIKIKNYDGKRISNVIVSAGDWGNDNDVALINKVNKGCDEINMTVRFLAEYINVMSPDREKQTPQTFVQAALYVSDIATLFTDDVQIEFAETSQPYGKTPMDLVAEKQLGNKGDSFFDTTVQGLTKIYLHALDKNGNKSNLLISVVPTNLLQRKTITFSSDDYSGFMFSDVLTGEPNFLASYTPKAAWRKHCIITVFFTYWRIENNKYEVGFTVDWKQESPNVLEDIQPAAILEKCPAKYYLQWVDRYGSLQSQPFDGKTTYSEQIDSVMIQNYSGHNRKVNWQVQPKWELNTQWLEDYMFPYYESIYVSPYLVLYDTTEDIAYDVTVKDSKYKEEQFRNNKQMFNLTLNIELDKKQNILN